jgi:hypothetical protein
MTLARRKEKKVKRTVTELVWDGSEKPLEHWEELVRCPEAYR